MYKNLKNTLQLIGTIPDKDEFDSNCRTLIHNLKSRYSRDELIEYLKSEDLNSKEFKIIEEACFITKDNELFSSIKEIMSSNQKALNFQKTLDWFKTPQCFDQVFRSKNINGISNELIDFFEKFTRNVLPSINSENYATIYTYIASGNMEKDFLENKYNDIEDDSFLSETILNNAKKHLIPFKMIGDDFSKHEIIIENSLEDFSHLNKTNKMAKSSYIDVVMLSPNGKDLFVSNITANTTSSDNNQHFEKRIKYNEELINISRKNDLNLIQCDFYKPELIKKSHLKEDIGNDNVDKLFYYINVLPHKIENFVNNSNHDIFLMGADVDQKMLKNNDVYEDFNNFLNIVMTFEDELNSNLKMKIKEALKVNANLIMKAINTEYTEDAVDDFKSKINQSNLQYISQSFQVSELNDISFKLFIPSEYIVEHNLTVYKNNKNNIKKNYSKKTMNKNQFLSIFNDEEKELIENSIEYLFNFMKDANDYTKVGDPEKSVTTRLLSSSVYKKLLNNEYVKGNVKEQKIYESFILFNKLGFNKNKLGYSNENIDFKGHELNTVLQLASDNFKRQKDNYSNYQTTDFNLAQKSIKIIKSMQNDCLKRLIKKNKSNFTEYIILDTVLPNFYKKREDELSKIIKNMEKLNLVDSDSLIVSNYLQKKLNSFNNKNKQKLKF